MYIYTYVYMGGSPCAPKLSGSPEFMQLGALLDACDSKGGRRLCVCVCVCMFTYTHTHNTFKINSRGGQHRPRVTFCLCVCLCVCICIHTPIYSIPKIHSTGGPHRLGRRSKGGRCLCVCLCARVYICRHTHTHT